MCWFMKGDVNSHINSIIQIFWPHHLASLVLLLHWHFLFQHHPLGTHCLLISTLLIKRQPLNFNWSALLGHFGCLVTLCQRLWFVSWFWIHMYRYHHHYSIPVSVCSVQPAAAAAVVSSTSVPHLLPSATLSPPVTIIKNLFSFHYKWQTVQCSH